MVNCPMVWIPRIPHIEGIGNLRGTYQGALNKPLIRSTVSWFMSRGSVGFDHLR